MYQAVHAANVHKGAVAGQALDHAGVGFAFLHGLPEGGALGVGLGSQHLADGAHDAAGRIVFFDDQLHLLLIQGSVVLVAAQSGLGSGHKHAHTLHLYHQAALVDLGDIAFQHGAVLGGLAHFLAALVLFQLLAAQVGDALLVTHIQHIQLQLIAHLHSLVQLHAGVVGEIVELHNAGLLAVNVDLDLVGQNAGHDSFHNIASADRLHGIAVDHFLEAQFLFTNYIAHPVKYLLNYRRWRGSPCGDPYPLYPFQQRRVEILGGFHRHCLGVLPGNAHQLLGVGGVVSADDDHQIAPPAQLLGLFLPRQCCITYCIKNLGVCIYFFQKLRAF